MGISGIKNVKYNYWKITVGHLRFHELRRSNFETDGGLVKYNWKWDNEQSLKVRIVIPFGHFGYLQFRLNKKCVMTDDNVATQEWKLNADNYMENTESFVVQHDALVTNDGRLMIGSGYYKWS